MSVQVEHVVAHVSVRIQDPEPDCLTSARRIYQAAGFRLDSEEKGMENGIEVTEQMWSLDLTATG